MAPAYGQSIYYTVTDLGTLRTIDGQGTSSAYAINDSGTVVGSAMCNSNQTPAWRNNRAFRLKPGGTMENLQLFGANPWFGIAFAISRDGTIAGGSARLSTSGAQAFRCSDGGALANLPYLGSGPDAWGMSVNGSGHVVGYSVVGGSGCAGSYCGQPWSTSRPGYAARWPSGSVVEELAGLGGYYSVANAINDAGEICGFGAILNGATHAFRIPPGGGTLDLGTLGGTNSEAWAINNSGHIVGCSLTAGNDNPHATLWTSMAPEDLGALPGKPYSAALAITDNSLIVGYVADTNSPTDDHLEMGWKGSNPRAALFPRGASPIDLNTCIATNSGWVLYRARGANGSGKIVGDGLHNGVGRAFLLTPCPILAARKNGLQVELYWNSQTNEQYQLQYCPDVTSGGWTDLGGPIAGNGTTNSVPADCSEPARFYRLIWLAN
jgi:probable HAF family extracellular repeat protein